MKWRIPKSKITGVIFLFFFVLLFSLPAVSIYYSASAGRACARCHEIRSSYNAWLTSTHRSINCKECHGGVLTFDLQVHLRNLRQVVTHLSGKAPERVRIKDRDLNGMVERCRSCHQQEFADWKSGPHNFDYTKIFLDEKHNRQELLIDDCLRCHGMYNEGGIRDLVAPVNTQGPWALLDPQKNHWPTIPCLACHQVHREGLPAAERPARTIVAGVSEAILAPSLALFDRREMMHLAAADLPLPIMKEGDRPVSISPDIRQALCYQCHAPEANTQVGSGDDRTCVGVHEGLSCRACHLGHGQKTRASCAACHPRLSNCGLDVEKMDTTFKSLDSPHNIHRVKCVDCHPSGVPEKKKKV